ncbi:Endonuclease/Exonuclease/phosphatase family protein [Bremerella volcania]|uniref:Endonuclease/Exonuclease/phosphatase family protein n=1 Tax=Bremerella volcania TaxID=2527984 RepID=A0A518C1L3_9BACT|nr:endonuclease/exonuclease/phosphatase family protein [Bremerella volcania]QDU73107.1 Endonuclease/Exonuclease/phosphatase family protein [Bremerella volcania]
MRRMTLMPLLVFCLFSFNLVHAEDIQMTVIGWNLESGDSDAATLAAQAADKGPVDIWGFSELEDQDFLDTILEKLEAEHGIDYEDVISTNAGKDKLGIVYNAQRLELVSSHQENSLQLGNPGLRPVLVAKFKGKATGTEFLVMVNHLKAQRDPNSTSKRTRQSEMLNDLAEAETLPVICLGDFNHFYEIGSADGNSPSFDATIEDGVFQWLEPSNPVPTHNFPGSTVMLDFIYVANPLAGWDGDCVILEREGNVAVTSPTFPNVPGSSFTDDGKSTDHRPIKATFVFNEATMRDSAEQLRDRISILRSLLEDMEAQLKAIEENLEEE